MAKAIAECKCKKCGEYFERVKLCRNRKEADSWETWASKYFDLCPDCYEEECTERLMQGKVQEMHYAEYKRNYAQRPTIPNSYNKTTKTILVVLKTVKELAEEKELMKQRANSSKSEIFTAAHDLARDMRDENPEMSYRECLSVCLKKVYSMVRAAKQYLAA